MAALFRKDHFACLYPISDGVIDGNRIFLACFNFYWRPEKGIRHGQDRASFL
jgi:hypothetical protein